MANLVEANNIAGLVVYGQQQVDYTVEGTSGCDFGRAVARASMLRAVAVESVLSAISGLVRKREQKLSDLGLALSYVAEACAQFHEDSHTDDTTTTSGLATAKGLLNKYDIDSSTIDYKDNKKKGQIKCENSQRLQTDVQYELDKEDNYLQQDMVSLQGYFSKRDQALSIAASMVKKVNKTMSSGIRAIH